LSDVAARALLEHAAVWSLPVDIYLERDRIHGIRNHGLRPYFVRHADTAAFPSVIGDERYVLGPEDRIKSTLETFLAARGRRLVHEELNSSPPSD
jgi:hypothetical protein